MIDAFTFVLGLTLAITGWFLCRVYVRFLRGSYALKARVTSIQQVFISRSNQEAQAFVKNGFYPVVAYQSPEGPISFTAIDESASGRFHVGDELRLRFTTTRRRNTRLCKGFSLLVIAQLILVFELVAALLFSDFALSSAQIVIASFVIAMGFAVLVLYLRDRDESCVHDTTRNEAGARQQLCLFEPTAFHHWKTALRDPKQRYKIRSSQFFGSMCFGFAMLAWAMSVQPAVM